jgi:transposase
MISIGVDISKLTFDVAGLEEDQGVKIGTYEYDKKGIAKFIQHLRGREDEVLVTMEATGRYHLRLAEALYVAGFIVSVVNPLIMKRYGEMKLRRIKTDKADAQLIAEYGANEKAVLFKPVSPQRRKILEILKGIDDFTLMKTQIAGRLEAFSIMPEPCAEVIACFQENLKQLEMSIKRMEKQLKECTMAENKHTYDLAQSVPGIGKRIGALTVGMFGNFEDFETAGQVVCYIGLTPFEQRSGTSVNRSGSISKKGSAYARKLFYLASLSAAIWNPHCRAFYQRLLAVGKEKKVAHIAVAHKLIRQVFGVVKNNKPYNSAYVSRSKIA